MKKLSKAQSDWFKKNNNYSPMFEEDYEKTKIDSLYGMIYGNGVVVEFTPGQPKHLSTGAMYIIYNCKFFNENFNK